MLLKDLHCRATGARMYPWYRSGAGNVSGKSGLMTCATCMLQETVDEPHEIVSFGEFAVS